MQKPLIIYNPIEVSSRGFQAYINSNMNNINYLLANLEYQLGALELCLSIIYTKLSFRKRDNDTESQIQLIKRTIKYCGKFKELEQEYKRIYNQVTKN